MVDGVVRKAQAEGSLRTDVGIGDIAVAFLLVARPVPVEREDTARMASQRCLALILASLRASADAELPGAPLTYSDLLE